MKPGMLCEGTSGGCPGLSVMSRLGSAPGALRGTHSQVLVGGGGVVQILAAPQLRGGSNMGLPSPLDGLQGPLAAPLLWALVAKEPLRGYPGAGQSPLWST